jgi:Fe-S oxidoreductase
MVFKRLLEKIPVIGGKILYYPGCNTRFSCSSIEQNYKQILEKLGIDYITIEEINCCGNSCLGAGFKEDFIDLIKKNKALFSKYNIKQIITNCPSCSLIFSEYYKIKTFHILEIISKNIHKFPQGKYSDPICYHDPCVLSRKKNIIDEPRKILEYLGFEIIEMDYNKRNTFCCGAGGGVKLNYPDVSSDIAKKRLSFCKTGIMITSCSLCYCNLKENTPSNIKVMEISEVLL